MLAELRRTATHDAAQQRSPPSVGQSSVVMSGIPKKRQISHVRCVDSNILMGTIS